MKLSRLRLVMLNGKTTIVCHPNWATAQHVWSGVIVAQGRKCRQNANRSPIKQPIVKTTAIEPDSGA